MGTGIPVDYLLRLMGRQNPANDMYRLTKYVGPEATADYHTQSPMPDIVSQYKNLWDTFMPQKKEQQSMPSWVAPVARIAQALGSALAPRPQVQSVWPSMRGFTQMTPEDARAIASVNLQQQQMGQEADARAVAQQQNQQRINIEAADQQRRAAEDPAGIARFQAVASALRDQNLQDAEMRRQSEIARQNNEYQAALRSQALQDNTTLENLRAQNNLDLARFKVENAPKKTPKGKEPPSPLTEAALALSLLGKADLTPEAQAALAAMPQSDAARAVVSGAKPKASKTNDHQSWVDAENYRKAQLKAAQDALKNIDIAASAGAYGPKTVQEPGTIWGSWWPNTVDNPNLNPAIEADKKRLLEEIAKWSTPTPLPGQTADKKIDGVYDPATGTIR